MTTAELRVIDYDEWELPGKADSTGTALMQTEYVKAGYLWRVERIVVSGNSANTCVITVYPSDSLILQRGRDWTPFPPGSVAVAEYPVYLTVRPNLPLSVVVTGAAPGDLFSAAVQYQLVEKVVA